MTETTFKGQTVSEDLSLVTWDAHEQDRDLDGEMT
jgi:hypothetical protein